MSKIVQIVFFDYKRNFLSFKIDLVDSKADVVLNKHDYNRFDVDFDNIIFLTFWFFVNLIKW
jgi:hypothetical protein